MDRWGRTPLTSAIESLQLPRVEFLLEHEATAGYIEYTLTEAQRTLNIIRNRTGDEELVVEGEEKLAKIKQLLVDKGLIQP